MPGFAGSSWYFYAIWILIIQKPLLRVPLWSIGVKLISYVGGTEHAVGHLMYSRFWHKFLNDLGYLNSNEPFKKLINQGMITAYGYYAANLLLNG